MFASLAFCFLQFPAPEMSLPDGVQTTEWAPFDKRLDRYVFVHATVGGKQGFGILDSGAGGTVINVDFAEAAELTLGAVAFARGVGGLEPIRLISDVEITWGSVQSKGMTSAGIDLTELGEHFNTQVDFILGREFFDAWVVEIDYPGSRLRVHDPKGFKMPEGMPTTKLHKRGPLYQVDCALEGGESILATVDTGSGAAIDVFQHQVDKQDLLKNRTVSDHWMGGIGGGKVVPRGTLKSMHICGETYEHVPATFHREKIPAFDKMHARANLGGGLFQQGVIILDAPHGRFAMKRVAPKKPFSRDRTGLQCYPSGEFLVIRHVSARSPAQKAGLTKEDKIAAVNGLTIPEMASNWKWRGQKKGTKFTLLLESGKKVDLVLEDYY